MTETPATTENAVAVRPARRLDLGAIEGRQNGGGAMFLPSTMQECLDFAMVMSKSDFAIPPRFRGNPGACLAVTIQASRWQADPFGVIQKAYVTKSKGGDERLAYEAQLVAAIVNTRAPIIGRLSLTYSGEGHTRAVKVEGTFRDTGEVRDIQTPKIGTIKIKNSPLWESDPDQQLAYYGMRSWGRRWVPEVLLGIYTPEEIAESDPVDAQRPERPRVTAAKPDKVTEGIIQAPVEEPPVEAGATLDDLVVAPQPETPITQDEAKVVDETRVDPGAGASRHGISGDGLKVPHDDGLELEVLREESRNSPAVPERDPSLDAFEKWDAFTNRSIATLENQDGDLKDERDFDDFSDATKKSISAAAITSDEKDELRARFVTAFLNAKRTKFGRAKR